MKRQRIKHDTAQAAAVALAAPVPAPAAAAGVGGGVVEALAVDRLSPGAAAAGNADAVAAADDAGCFSTKCP
jgi:hypothetical protein